MAEYPFFIIVFLALISLPILMILTSKIIRFILGKKENVSNSIYECGEPSIETSWKRIPISYFKIALIFILFDIELVFIFPWILNLAEPTQGSYFSCITFLIILFIGWIYAYKKGYLEWEM